MDRIEREVETIQRGKFSIFKEKSSGKILGYCILRTSFLYPLFPCVVIFDSKENFESMEKKYHPRFDDEGSEEKGFCYAFHSWVEKDKHIISIIYFKDHRLFKRDILTSILELTHELLHHYRMILHLPEILDSLLDTYF